MTETRVVTFCADCNVFWYPGGEEPTCTQADHQHREFSVHRHLDAVVLPDRTTVTAASFDPADPYARDRPPDYGLYLDDRWRPPWAHDHVDWPDFGVPADPADLVSALGSLLERARAGQEVEVGCLGGHGRTGTSLAVLAVLSGLPPDRAVAWVRDNYCPQAVETPEQESLIGALSG